MTAKKKDKADDALRESEHRYRNLFEYSSDAIFIHDDKGHMLNVNQRAVDMLGYTRDELLALSMVDYHPQEVVDVAMAAYNELAKAGHGRFDSKFRKKDGSLIDVAISAQPIEPVSAVFQTLVRDITYRKRAEEALRATVNYSRNLIETSLDPLVTISAEGKITDVNKATVKTTGVSRERLIGSDFVDYFTEPEKAHDGYLKVFEQGQVTDYPLAIRHTSGAITDVLFNASVYRNEQGQVLGVFAAARDITKLKRMEKELREKNDETVLFTYTVSHDLKSPLVTIKTFLGYLEQDILKQDAARMEKDIGYISGAADKMSRLLDDVLEFSRVGRKMNPSVEAPLQTIVKDALDLVAGQISARGVQVEVTEEPALLYGDRPLLVEVFQNLVDNAVKFMGDQAAPLVEIGVEPKGDEWVFFVRDNGIGIDPRHQGKVFGLFEKLNPDTEGNGIGLAMMRRIVEVHGGKIWLESAGSGKGTTFRFTLSKTKLQRT